VFHERILPARVPLTLHFVREKRTAHQASSTASDVFVPEFKPEEQVHSPLQLSAPEFSNCLSDKRGMQGREIKPVLLR